MLAAASPVRRPAAQVGFSHFALGVLLAVLGAILASSFWFHQAPIRNDDAITERIRPVADLELAPPATASAEVGKRTGVFLVYQSCRSCHSSGEGGAPKIGDSKAWAPRVNQGLEALVQAAVSGKCGAPPRGGSDADDMELARAVVYMIWPRMRL